MFTYEPTLDTLQLKIDKCTELCTSFWHSISGYKVGIKFDKDYLAVEKNNYATKTINGQVFIAYWVLVDLSQWNVCH